MYITGYVSVSVMQSCCADWSKTIGRTLACIKVGVQLMVDNLTGVVHSVPKVLQQEDS